MTPTTPTTTSMPPSSKKAPEGTQAIQRALQLLEELARGPRDRGLGDLAAALDLTKPTAHRILAALEAGGLVARAPRDAAYRLGPGAGELDRAGARQRGLSLPQATPFHRRILERTSGVSWREWSGYLCPLSYSHSWGREYWAVREAAGVIDVSPLHKVEVRGPQARDLLQRVMTRDLSKLRPGRVAYSAWCDDAGKILQDGNLVCLAEDRFRLTAAHPTQGWLEDCGAGLDAEVVELSRELAALALQGPRSRAILEEICDPESEIGALRYFGARTTSIAGVPVEVTRTGFTGDLGYELWMASEGAEAVWDALFEAGEKHGLQPFGLDALDVLRIEAGLILIDVDFVPAHLSLLERRKSTPDEVGLGWAVGLVDGNEFVGRRAIEQERERGVAWAMVGVEIPWFELERVHRELGLRPLSPGQSPVRKPAPLIAADRQVGPSDLQVGQEADRHVGQEADRQVGQEADLQVGQESDRHVGQEADLQVGQVTSQVFSPLLKRHIGIASVRADVAAPGTTLELEAVVDVRRVRFRATVRPMPFFDPERKRATPPPPKTKSREGSAR